MTTEKTSQSATTGAWLDEALRLAVAPPVSDTLRARVLRRFAAAEAMPANRATGGLVRPAIAAAVVVMAVALGIVHPAPDPARTVAPANVAAQAALPAEEAGAVQAGLALIADGPDVADVSLALAWSAGGEVTEDGGLLDGLPLQ